MKSGIIERRVLRPDLMRPVPEGTVPMTTVTAPLQLGDWVETWAKPIGCGLDRLTKSWPFLRTRLCGCSACSRRRQCLNAAVPDCLRWRGGWYGRSFARAIQRVYLPGLRAGSFGARLVAFLERF